MCDTYLAIIFTVLNKEITKSNSVVCNCRPIKESNTATETSNGEYSESVYSDTEVQTIVHSRLVATGLRFTIF